MANPKGNAAKFQTVAASQTAAVIKDSAGEAGEDPRYPEGFITFHFATEVE